MGRSDVIQLDLERIRGMSDEEFEEKWGDWAREADRDLHLVRQRWVGDLERALPYARAEDEAVRELVAAKDAYRSKKTPKNKARREAAVQAVRELRVAERTRPGRQFVAGDAFVTGR